MTNKILYLKIDNWSHQFTTTQEFNRLLNFLKVKFKDVILKFQWEQINDFLEYQKSLDHSVPIISLDPLIKSVFNLEIGRSYSYINGSYTFTGHQVRLESFYKSIDDQFHHIEYNLQQLNINKVALYDDDIVYGGQFKFVKYKLKELGIEVVSEHVYLDNSKQEFEILDLRDLILDAPYGGMYILTTDRRMCYIEDKALVKEHCSIKVEKDIQTFIELCKALSTSIPRENY
jgi:hypothetical protein